MITDSGEFEATTAEALNLCQRLEEGSRPRLILELLYDVRPSGTKADMEVATPKQRGYAAHLAGLSDSERFDFCRIAKRLSLTKAHLGHIIGCIQHGESMRREQEVMEYESYIAFQTYDPYMPTYRYWDGNMEETSHPYLAVYGCPSPDFCFDNDFHFCLGGDSEWWLNSLGPLIYSVGTSVPPDLSVYDGRVECDGFLIVDRTYSPRLIICEDSSDVLDFLFEEVLPKLSPAA